MVSDFIIRTRDILRKKIILLKKYSLKKYNVFSIPSLKKLITI